MFATEELIDPGNKIYRYVFDGFPYVEIVIMPAVDNNGYLQALDISDVRSSITSDLATQDLALIQFLDILTSRRILDNP